MKKIKRKNYIILALILILTVFVTFFLSQLYKNRQRSVSDFYNYANKINGNEIEQYLIENPDVILYISDKYDLSNDKFEKDFKEKLSELNINDMLIFVEKSDIDKAFLNSINADIKLSNTPVVILILDKEAREVKYVTENSDASTVINYEALE